ncbi:hypothetical protein [Streptomyces yunnanensis]|nr:hypothetical protein [Streptomyces yunnanensis]
MPDQEALEALEARHPTVAGFVLPRARRTEVGASGRRPPADC